MQLELDDYRLKDREMALKIASLEATIEAQKKAGGGGKGRSPILPPRAHEEEYNLYARRACAIAYPFLSAEDLRRPFSPDDHLSPDRWSSTDAILRGRTAQVYARFPQHLHEDLRLHAATQTFVRSYIPLRLVHPLTYV